MIAEKKTIFGLVAAAAVLLAALAVSCGEDPVSTEPEDEIELAGTSWKLTSVESVSDTLFDGYENGIWQVPETAQYLLEFTSDSSVYAFLYCEECPDGEGSRFEVVGEDSVSIQINCESGSICQKNIPVRERLESVVAVEQEGETLTAEYVLTGDENVEFRGVLYFRSADNVRPEEVSVKILREHYTGVCGFRMDNIELGQENKDMSDVELRITNKEDLEHYLNCSDETVIDLNENFILAGISNVHHQCLYIKQHNVFIINDVLHYNIAINQAACMVAEHVRYAAMIPRDYLDYEIVFRVYWRSLL